MFTRLRAVKQGRRAPRHESPAPLLPAHSDGFAAPADDLVSGTVLKGPSDADALFSARDVLEQWGVPEAVQAHVPMLFLVEPVCSLLLRGCWSELLFLARWSQAPWKPELEFPPAAWAQEFSGQHLIYKGRPQPAKLSELKSLSSDLRRWAPRIIPAGARMVRGL